MVLHNQKVTENIKDLLSGLEREIEYDNKAQNFEVNQYAEDFYRDLLNMIFPKWQLINLNTKKHNHPAIDLGCTTNKIGIQVTSDNSKSKVDKTLKTFYDHKLESDYDTLYILMIKGRGSIVNQKISNEGSLKFDKASNIVDNTVVLNWIKQRNFTVEQLEEIEKLIRRHLRQKPMLFNKVLLPFQQKIQTIKKFENHSLGTIYLTNFNYNSNSFDKIYFNNLLQHLNQYKKEVQLVIFNGNFIESSVHHLDTFLEDVLNPLMITLELDMQNIIFNIGANEVELSKVINYIDMGLLAHAINEVNVEQIIQTIDMSQLAKIAAYKNFEKYIYQDIKDWQSHPLDSSHIAIYKNIYIGISCLNSVWTFSENNKGKSQLIGKHQINNSLSYIYDTDIKILLSYHPFDFLKKFDSESSISLAEKYELVMFGHNQDTKYQSRFYKNTFYLLQKENINYIKFDIYNQNVDIHSFNYNHNLNSFETIKQKIDFPTEDDNKRQELGKSILNTIRRTFIDEIDKNLINYGTDSTSPSSVNEIFVIPSISSQIYDKQKKEKNDKEIIYINNVIDLIEYDKNVLLMGGKESGKSLLLHKLMIEYSDNYERYMKLPIFIDFYQLENDSIESIVKQRTGISKGDVTILLERGDLVILIDHIVFEEEYRLNFKELDDFALKFSKVKIISTALIPLKHYIPLEFEDDFKNCSFQLLHIKDFATKQIKLLAKKWFKGSNNFNVDSDLEKLVKNFYAFGLPCTPMSVSLFFWIIEKQEQRPINNSVLLSQFIDNLLDKLNKNQVYRDKFDATNKTYLLADIAYNMFKNEKDNYAIEYGKLIDFISNYLVNKGFNGKNNQVFNPSRILNNFIDRGIFAKDANLVKFRFACFFHFFLAQKMIIDSDFKEYVFEEDNYLNFSDEINFYTGLKRDDAKALNLMYERSITEFEAFPVVPGKIINSFFREENSIANKIDMETIVDNKPNEAQIDEMNDKKLENAPVKTKIEKKEKKVKNFAKLIELSGQVLRNSEEVNNKELKEKFYAVLLKNSITVMFFYKYFLVSYYNKHRQLPDYMATWDIDIITYLRYLPLLHQLWIYDFLASQKLSNIIREKIEQDESDISISEIEKFFSVFIYTDLKGVDYKSILKKYIKDFVKTNTIIDLSFFKIITYFYLRSKAKTTEEALYVDLLTELQTKNDTQFVRSSRRELLKQQWKKNKNSTD